ncbi:MAG: alanine--glyoxylate aminotransferase family protein [Thermotaleaceae bacterium]
MKNTMIMTPGPTTIHEDVRLAMARPITNPDLDSCFYEFYKETCQQLQKLYKTQNEILILSGEGILGLEAACASLIEPGDRVLCIDNGIFGNGFGDFIKMYGGEAVYFKSDYRKSIDIAALKNFLEMDHDFKIATLVHCETPSGITNGIEKICPLLKSYDIITVVDAVSSLGGEPLETDKWEIDMVLGGSQKCLSASPGLTMLSISDTAWGKILNRKAPISGFYSNLSIWKNWYGNKWFPYTQPISQIYGLKEAVDRWLGQENPIQRHARIGAAVRESLVLGGLEMYPQEGFSNTVTTVIVPEGISFHEVYEKMYKEHQILIAGAFDFLKDKVFRIGHMGENCHEDKLYVTLKALNKVLRDLNYPLKVSLHRAFVECIEK